MIGVADVALRLGRLPPHQHLLALPHVDDPVVAAAHEVAAVGGDREGLAHHSVRVGLADKGDGRRAGGGRRGGEREREQLAVGGRGMEDLGGAEREGVELGGQRQLAQQRERSVEEEECLRLQAADGDDVVVGRDRDARRVGGGGGGERAARLVRVQHVVRAEAAVVRGGVQPVGGVGVRERGDGAAVLAVLLEERGRRDVEDADGAVVEAARHRVLGRVVRHHARAVGLLLHFELDELLVASHRPDAHLWMGGGMVRFGVA